MAKAYALRAGGSGPVFDGDAGDVLTLQSDGTAKFAPGGGGGGSVPPLTLTYYVDQGRAGSTQDGSIANPFLTIQNGIDAIEASLAGEGSLLVAEGDYASEVLSVPLTITIVGMTKQIIVGGIGAEDDRAQPVKLVNVLVVGPAWFVGGLFPVRVEGGGLLAGADLTGEPRLEGLNASFGTVTCIDVLGILIFRGCSVAGVAGAEGGFHADEVHMWDCTTVGDIECENAFLHLSSVDGSLTANRATLEQSIVADGLLVSNTLTADTFSLQQARATVFDPNPAPLLTKVTDHNCGFGVIAVPAIEQGSFADVTIGAPGLFAKEGDGVVVNMANPQLANVGIAACWINAAGEMKIRFFGTTAGGNQTFNYTITPITP